MGYVASEPSESFVCVGKNVRAAFNTLTPSTVYERASRCWRDRLEIDALRKACKW